jgi:type IV secretory pathway TraG/TraD family ATPase VirD4
LLTQEVLRCFNGSDFTAQDIMILTRSVTVYLCWPESELLALAPIIRLVWGSLINDLIETYDTAKKEDRLEECRPILLPIEEAGRVPLPMLSEAATTVCGREMSFLTSFQSVSQLEAAYGQSRAQILRDNMDSQIYYRPTDLQTAEYLEKRLGSRSGFAHSQTLQDGTETSHGRQERPIPLLSSQEILQFPFDEIIGFHSNKPPFRAKSINWRRSPTLVARSELRPKKLPPLPEQPETHQYTLHQHLQRGSFAYINPNGL